MRYQLENGKSIHIPDADIEKYMKTLDLTREEAIDTWLDDEGYNENEEVEELTAKAKESGIMHIIHEAKAESKPKKKREFVQKEDPIKEEILIKVAELLKGETNIDKVEITNKTKILEFDLNGEHYKFDLIRTRNGKNGKSEKK